MLTIMERETTTLDEARLVSFSQPVDDISPLEFLRAMTARQHNPSVSPQRFYWEHADADYAFAGFGTAVVLTASGADRFDIIDSEMRDLLGSAVIETVNDHIIPRLFGGFSFGANTPLDGIWGAFSRAYFVLPRYVLTHYSGITWLTVNAYVKRGQERTLRNELENIARLIENADHHILRRILGHASARRQPSQISYPLSQEAWHTQVSNATERMKAGELDKVVLSRTCDITFDTPIEPLDALANLETRYASAYRFLIEPQPGSAFFGATPELLVELNGRDFKTAGLAGSIKRGETPNDDDQLAAQLWSNPKERYEHGLVVDSLRDLLEPRSRELIIPEVPGLLKLSNIQHLYTPIYGDLNTAFSALQMVETLHPTPALGGYPRNIAVEIIINTETISRGWYASPVGWMDGRGDGTFAVAIRSAVSTGNQARLYAGAGIVADSVPDREWDETRLKFRPMLEALNAEIQ